jgi:hypothetical protein
MRLDYTDDGRTWPLPYVIRWQDVQKLEDAAQVVDGKWIITNEGIRTAEKYYDRALAIGDDSWRNYEVTTTVTFHDFTPGFTPPNDTRVAHAAIATRWPGHDVDEYQPHQKWYPLGATSEFVISKNLDQCHWRMLDRNTTKKTFFSSLYDTVFGSDEKYSAKSERRRMIELNRAYAMKHRVVTEADGRTHYAVKLWPHGEAEPEAWDLIRTEADDLVSGSALLLAHHADVTFGDIHVVPVDPRETD